MSVSNTPQIEYTTSIKHIQASMLHGFFEGWLNPPSAEDHLEILKGSTHVVIAIAPKTERVVGFTNALGDGANSAFIPLLEVLPEYRGLGIGTQLMNHLLSQLEGYRCIDLCCDTELQPFYGKLGMKPSVGMMLRRPHQSR